MIEEIIIEKVGEVVSQLYSQIVEKENIVIQKTHKDFDGDYTVVAFPFTKFSGKSPEDTAKAIGEDLIKKLSWIKDFNTVKGFLNISISDEYWLEFFNANYSNLKYGQCKEKKNEKPIIVEYSSPNTNKPLHLGHVRNNLLGWSVAEILKFSGKKVVKVNLVNDRGIHICKSMLAWERWGEGETPESSGLKGDHLVGKYYVKFDTIYKQEVQEMVSNGSLEHNAMKLAPTIIDAQEMLQDWEKGDSYTLELWNKMNSWVYQGFEKTYERMGIDFDKVYHESDTYLDGKKIVEKGLSDGILYQEEDGSIWANLSKYSIENKLLLRADGTSVYMTQDLGTAKLRYEEFNPEKLVYVVGNEQNYHFDVLKMVLKELGYTWSDDILHLSYGMVELPQGKMKSREGTVVDADELMDEMYKTAKVTTIELGKIEDFNGEQAEKLYNMVSLGALKYFILKVDPKKNMMFNPEESIDFNGNTGPFIQYTHARIKSLLQKGNFNYKLGKTNLPHLLPKEKELIKLLYDFKLVVCEASENYNPALIANYLFELAKDYNQFYHEVSVLKAETKELTTFRLTLSAFVGNIIKSGMHLLGIEVPEKM